MTRPGPTPAENPHGIAYVADLVREGQVRPKRSLGQNFLVDANILGKVVQALGEVRGRTILEIGAGLGALTLALAEAGAGRVIAVEKDRSLIPHLETNVAGHAAVHVTVGDALKLDLPALARPSGNAPGDALVAGNLPYSITTPLLMKLREPPIFWQRAVVMVQWEVARRILAAPGGKDYGSLTVALAAVSRPSLIFRVSRNCFYPRPEVDSAVVGFERRDPPAGGLDGPGLRRLETLVRAAFGQRRKTLANALSAGLGLDRPEVETRITSAGIDPGRRGETLSLEEFVVLERVFGGIICLKPS